MTNNEKNNMIMIIMGVFTFILVIVFIIGLLHILDLQGESNVVKINQQIMDEKSEQRRIEELGFGPNASWRKK